MSVLLIDGDGDLWYERKEKLGVQCIEMPYTYNDETYYYDLGKNTDFKKFYSAMRNGAVATTQALNPEEYKEIIEPIFAKGEDILYVSFSGKMSGTFGHLETALNQLHEKYPERKLTRFDTKSICLGAGMQMEEAAILKNQGKSDKEIVKALESFTDKVAMYFVVDDLVYLKRGGRLSAAAAFMGTLLNLKPILSTDSEGSLCAIDKIPSKRKAIKTIAEKVVQTLTDVSHPVYVLDADCPEDGDYLANLIKEKRPDANIVRQIVGPVIGSHCGPGTIGVIYVADSRPVPLKK